MRWWSLVALISSLALVAPSARAQPGAGAAPAGAASFKALVDAGLEAYAAKRYADAIVAFEQAYQLQPEPELVYNVARAHEKALHRDEAIAAYERFMKLPGTTAELRTKALGALESLRAEQAALEKAERARASASLGTAGAARAPADAATTAAPSDGSRVLAGTLMGVGGAGLAVGAVFGVLALNAKSDFDGVDRTATGAAERRASLKADVERNALVADVAIIAGAATAITGLVLFLLDDGAEPAASTAWAPTVGPSGVGVVGRF
jgi:tetratricopeptide (TPR) repeat protein